MPNRTAASQPRGSAQQQRADKPTSQPVRPPPPPVCQPACPPVRAANQTANRALPRGFVKHAPGILQRFNRETSALTHRFSAVPVFALFRNAQNDWRYSGEKDQYLLHSNVFQRRETPASRIPHPLRHAFDEGVTYMAACLSLASLILFESKCRCFRLCSRDLYLRCSLYPSKMIEVRAVTSGWHRFGSHRRRICGVCCRLEINKAAPQTAGASILSGIPLIGFGNVSSYARY